MGETFGEADIVLRLRLDELEQDIATSERMVVESTERVAVEREKTQRAFSGDRSAVESALATRGAWALVRDMYSAVTLALRALGIASAATAAAGVAGTVALVAAVAVAAVTVTHLGVEWARSMNKAIAGVKEAQANLDGTTERTRELAEALEQVPVMGRAIGVAFRLMAGDAELADEQMTKFVATVEDGEVKVGRLGRLVGNLWIAAQNTGGIVGMLGINGTDDPIGDIDDDNSAMRLDKMLQSVRDQMNEGTAGIGQQSADMAREAQRAAAAEGLEGVEAIRAAERTRFEDAERGYDALAKRAHEAASAGLESIRAEQAAGNIGEREARLARMQVSASLESTLAGIARDRENTEANIAEKARRQVEAFREQEMAQAKLAEAAARRLESLTREASLRAGGDEFGASIEAVERQRREALSRAGETGEDIGLINAYYNAVLAVVERGERDRLQREQEFADRRMANQQQAAERIAEIERRQEERRQQEINAAGDERARLRSRIFEERMRQAGDERGADEERIRQDFEEQILRAIDENDPERERLLVELRDLKLAGLDIQNQQGRSREIGSARLSATGTMGDGREEVKVAKQDEVVATLKSIDRKTEPAKAFK